MKAITCFLPLLFLMACQHSKLAEPTIQEETARTSSNQEDTSTEDSSTVKAPSLVTVIDRDEARKLNASTSAIGTEIRKILISTEIEMSIDDLLKQRLVFRNNKGMMIDILLESVIDTIYFE